MTQALLDFLAACWKHTSIPSLVVGAAAGYYGQPVYDFIIGLLPMSS